MSWFSNMFQPEDLEESVQRKVLLVVSDSSRNQAICDLLQMMDCKCMVALPREVFRRIELEVFDAILFDLTSSPVRQEQLILAIRETRPTLLQRILLITNSVKPEIHEYLNLPAISKENPLSELWSKLEEIFAARHSPVFVPPGMISAQLIFDSLRMPSVAGIRGPLKSGRQLTYQHQSATINLLVHQKQEENCRVSLVGQVLDVSMRAVHDLPVLLCNKNRTLARTSTSEFGEFALEFDSVEFAGVQVRLAEGSWIYMPLENTGKNGNSIPGLDAGT
jgi:hypothetical protein